MAKLELAATTTEGGNVAVTMRVIGPVTAGDYVTLLGGAMHAIIAHAIEQDGTGQLPDAVMDKFHRLIQGAGVLHTEFQTERKPDETRTRFDAGRGSASGPSGN